MNRRRALQLAAAAAALLVCLPLGWGVFVMPPVTAHHGDGTFADLSRRTPFAIPGYSISMPEFDLAEPHHAEYRFSGLPNIGRECGLYLAFRDHDDRWWRGTEHMDVGGQLRLELLDSEGREVVNVSGRLGQYTWYGQGDLHALYQLRKSFFRSDSRQEYRARIWYTPDPRLAGYKGFVYVRAGGSK